MGVTFGPAICVFYSNCLTRSLNDPKDAAPYNPQARLLLSGSVAIAF